MSKWSTGSLSRMVKFSLTFNYLFIYLFRVVFFSFLLVGWVVSIKLFDLEFITDFFVDPSNFFSTNVCIVWALFL